MIIRFNEIEREKIVEKSINSLWSDSGKEGLKYLRQVRKLSDGIIKRFRLGFVPSWTNHQLAGRVIFPLYDASNNLIIVSTRLISGKSVLPGHWHESYEKKFYIYGVNLAKYSMFKWRFCVCVEGQCDVLQMHNYGMTNVVGLLGTKLDIMQKSVINRYCDEIMLLFDKDENKSGQNAAQKALKMFPDDKIISIELDKYADPDEYVRLYGFSKIKDIMRSGLKYARSEQWNNKC